MEAINKNQSEMKETLIKIKFYRESRVEWTKPRIKLMIWNIRKQKNNQSEQEEEK